MNDARIVKLVRDKIGVLLNGRHNVIEYSGHIDGEEHVKLLRGKLVEEAVEYLLDPSESELADVLECVYGLATVDLNVSFDRVNNKRLTKRYERGGFDQGLAMFACSDEEARQLRETT